MLFSVIYAVRQPEFSVELYLQSIKRINVETIGIKIYVFYPHFQTLKTRSEGPFFWEKCYQDPYRSTMIKVIYMSISNNTWFYYQNLLGYKTLTSIAQFEISFRTATTMALFDSVISCFTSFYLSFSTVEHSNKLTLDGI